MNPKISVIVPMYNVERYLDRCVKSLLKQTLTNIEIILVDDGSPDGCGCIAEAYSKQDCRVKVVHKRNGGLSSARNSGIEVATGEYIGFVDSDDWVEPTMYEKLYNKALINCADIVVGGHQEVIGNKIQTVDIHPLAGKIFAKHSQIHEIRNRLLGHSPYERETKAFPMRVWTNIYQKDLIDSNHLKFEKIFSEDTIFNLFAYDVAQRIVFTAYTDYCYRIDNHRSIMHTIKEDTLRQYEKFIERLYEIAQYENEQYEDCIVRVSRMAIEYSRVYATLVVNSDLNMNDKMNYLRTLSKSKLVTEYCSNYPIRFLTIKQRIFQNELNKHNFYIVYMLIKMRKLL